MSCENLTIPKPTPTGCSTSLFGIPYGVAGRTVGATTYPVSGIVLHCYPGTAAELCNEMKCRTKQSAVTGLAEQSYHYGIGANIGFYQHISDDDISWTFGSYKANSYITAPPPNVSVNWPTLQGLYGINVTPDVYTIDIALAIGHVVEATQAGCFTCPTSSGLQENQHDILVQLLAYLVQEYGIDIDSEHITFHDLINCDESQECACTDIDTLLTEVAAVCAPCEGDVAVPAAPVADSDDEILYTLGITEACCPETPGCYVKIPWDGCFIGDLAVDGTLDSYILGLAQDPTTLQWCLTRGCLGVVAPLIGCGTVDDPLRLDLCLWGDYIPDEPAANIVNLAGLDAEGCLIESPVADIIELYQTPITVVDTESVDLTVSGTADHTLQADVLISADGGNQIEIRPDGLFADFTCVDVFDSYPEGDIDLLVGTDILDDCVYEKTSDLIDRLLCLLPEDAQNEPTWLLGKTAQDCPVFVAPENIVSAGLAVLDSTTVDLTLAANVLSADAIIDPAGDNILRDDGTGLYVPEITFVDSVCSEFDWTPATRTLSVTPIISAALDNVLECVAQGDTGLYVPDLTVVDTNCVDLTYSNRELTAAIIESQAGDNILTCAGDGLYVPDLTVLDTNCIDLTYAGRQLTAGVIVSPTGDNILECAGNGLYVPDLTVADTDCVDLTYAGGQLTADVIVSGAGDNVLECTGNGLYVQAGAGIQVSDTDCLDLSLVGGIISGVITLAPAQGLTPNVAQCIAGQGFYVPQGAGLTVTDTNCIDLTMANGNLTADLTINPSGDNQVSCGPGGLYVPTTAGLVANDTDCVNHNLVGGTLSTTLNIAPAQSGIPNILSCVTGQGLYVPEIHITVVDTTCIDLTFAGGVMSADVILDPSGNNQLQCLPAGLYVPPGAGLTTLNSDCVGLNLAGTILTSTIILAGPIGGIPNAITCEVGEGLYTPIGAGVSVTPGNCVDITFNGVTGEITVEAIIDPAADNALTCEPTGLYIPEITLCTLGQEIATTGPETVTEDNFVILDTATDCLTRGDRLHNLTAGAIPAFQGIAEGYTIGSKWIVPAGTYPGQIRAIEYIMVSNGNWQKVGGGTSISTGESPAAQVIPTGVLHTPNLVSTGFDVLGEVNLGANNMVSAAGGNQQTHLALLMDFPVPPGGGADLVVEAGVLVNGFSAFSPIVHRYRGFTGGESVNITGVTQGYSTTPGDVIEVFIRHNAGGPANLTNLVINHYEDMSI